MGYISPNGGDYFKSTLMAAVVDTSVKNKRCNGREAVKKDEKEEKAYLKEMEVCGTDKFSQDEECMFSNLTELLMKGRIETPETEAL